MIQGTHTTARRAFTRFFTGLCLIGLAGGVGLCMLQGQGSKSLRLAAAAQAYHAQSQGAELTIDSIAYLRGAARESAWRAVAYDPASREAWLLLSDVLLQSQQMAAAAETRRIAENMGSESAAPAAGYAAIFNPSSLARGDE